MQVPVAAVEITEYPRLQSGGPGVVIVTPDGLVVPPAAADAFALALKKKLLAPQNQLSLGYPYSAGCFEQPEGSLCAIWQSAGVSGVAAVPGFFRPVVRLYTKALHSVPPESVLQPFNQ